MEEITSECFCVVLGDGVIGQPRTAETSKGSITRSLSRGECPVAATDGSAEPAESSRLVMVFRTR